MSALNDFIAYCISEYRCPGRCTSCKNDKRCNNAQNCYIPCIKHIHDVNNSSSHYNCENMALCYILKHFYRFSAEIEAALERHIKIPLNRQLHFASIGCGPASELLGITNFLEHHPNSNLSFTYKGFDNSTIWKQAWEYISTNIANTEFIASDFFEYYNEHSKPNVVIVNYMLSDMSKFHHEGIHEFLDKLYMFIDSMEYGMLIINDITYYGRDEHTANGCIAYLHRKFAQNKACRFYYGSFNQVSFTKRFFGNNQLSPPSSKIASINMPLGISPFTDCNSLQYIIIKDSSQES